MIRKLKGEPVTFVLDTEHTTYAFSVAASGHLEHLYYGAKIPVKTTYELAGIRERHEFELGNVIVYSPAHKNVFLEDMMQEAGTLGHGDVREPMIEAVMPDGSRSLNFLYQNYILDYIPPVFNDLPHSYSEKGRVEHLAVNLSDRDLSLTLHYCVYPKCDVITRSAVLTNNGKGTVELERALSAQLDLPGCGYSVTSFRGAWAREMNKTTIPLPAGKITVESRAGVSSNRANPFFMVHLPDTTEDSGDCYGFNLVYSGSHYSAVEVNGYGKTRIVTGIQPQGFRWLLGEGECFETPEAVMTYSNEGFTGQSKQMHRFVREHIVRGNWKRKARPVLINSWETSYFNISENSLLSLAKSAKELGVELLVMDDGWFGDRSDDTKSLGDWNVNTKKLPGGLKRLGDKLNAMGMEFGIWVEPEMISVNSRLFEAHRDWCMAVPFTTHSEGRNQRILDLCNPEVTDWLIKKMTEVFSSANISYVKWDMNRIFSDVFSPALPKEKQGETAHRYMLGLYRVMKTLCDRFPDILFEGCASGGNRFDLGILSYFPQIWASDNTDAVCRADIQEGYSYGYPLSCISAHVSASPNHQTLRETPLDTRFNVAAFAQLGYECNLKDLPLNDKKKISLQITLFKFWRESLFSGDFYRVRTGNIHEWLFVAKDKKRAIGMIMQELSQPNTQAQRFFAKGLDKDRKYRFFSLPGRINVKQFGSLINTLSPIHIKQDSLLHNVVARAIKMDGEHEDYIAAGGMMMTSGISLSPAFSGSGFNDKVRMFPDFASRLYFIEEVGKFSDKEIGIK